MQISNLKNLAAKLNKTGFISIFLSNIIVKFVVFLGGIILVRILSPQEYGEYAYVLNCFGILCILNDFGCNITINQFCGENYKNKEKFREYLSFGLSRSLLFSMITCFLIFISPIFYPYTTQSTAELTRLLSLLPLITNINAVLLNNLRVRLENKLYSYINVFASFSHYVIIVPIAYIWGLWGAVLSAYIIQFVVLVFSIIISSKKLDFKFGKTTLTKNEKTSYYQLAIANQINSAAESLIILMDIFIIGLVIPEFTAVSEYKVGANIPTNILFVQRSILIYVLPYFIRNIKNSVWIRKNYNKLVGYSAIINAIIVIGGLLAGEWLIPLLFGEEYISAIPYFNILLTAYFFNASFKMPTFTLFSTQRKVKINIIFTVIAGVLNTMLNIFLILRLGTIGVAYATLIVKIVIAVIAFTYAKYYLKYKM